MISGIRMYRPLPILFHPWKRIWIICKENARFGKREHKFPDMPAMKKMQMYPPASLPKPLPAPSTARFYLKRWADSNRQSPTVIANNLITGSKHRLLLSTTPKTRLAFAPSLYYCHSYLSKHTVFCVAVLPLPPYPAAYQNKAASPMATPAYPAPYPATDEPGESLTTEETSAPPATATGV